MKEFDEQEALQYMRDELSQASDNFSDDELYFILDSIWDYYDEKGELDLSDFDDNESETDLEEILAYVVKGINKDKEFRPKDSEEIKAAIKGEINYEKELEEDI